MAERARKAKTAEHPASASQQPDGRRRWPGRVFDVGDEPDPRFSLANERTFLAWIRTSLALIAAGVAVAAFVHDIPVRCAERSPSSSSLPAPCAAPRPSSAG